MTSKAKNLALKARICSIARVVACASFLVLTIIGVSSLVRAMSLEDLANENGIPAAWEVSSLGNPDTITVPITYWDQKIDSCDDPNRQFEWVECGYWTKGVLQGLVKPTLGSDGLPIPTFSSSDTAWAINHDVFSMNITGNDPVQPTDNFYRWFHEVPGVSKQIDNRTVTFHRTGSKTYTYGGQNIFPIDNVSGLNASDTQFVGKDGKEHNFHFTAHLNFSVKIDANGQELFEFSGDDDVWVYLNNQLVLDIGGLHEAIYGWFLVNEDGTLTTFIEKVNDTAARSEELTSCMKEPYGDFNTCVDPFNQFLLDGNMHDIEVKTLDIGLHPGDVVNLDFFYAERSTTESNTHITISNMNWPISADSNLENKIVGKVENSNSNIVKYNTSITNRDPSYPLDLIRMATYINEKADATDNSNGFLPLSSSTLYYTTTPDGDNSWQPVEISAPSNTLEGFTLATPIRMAPYGQTGDTLYFRFYAETADALRGKVDCLTSYYTELSGATGVTYDNTTIDYGTLVKPDPGNNDQDKAYTVTVKYVYSDGSEALPDRSMTDLKSGDDFTFITPNINGFTPDQNIIVGVIEDHNLAYIVTYYPEQEEQLYKVTIDYVYEDGDPAYESFHGNYKPNADFSVDSPIIPGYTPNKSNVSGRVTDQDLYYTVIYRTNPTPTTPTDPVTPTTPEPPRDDTIIGTLIPGNGLGDASLIYLAPLGAVAYVPNTGVISNAAANLFNEGFAEVVLSQGFVMGILLIFAGAFAIYFSLRDASRANEAKKQRALARAAANARKTAHTTKNRSRTTQKSSQKTTRKASTANAKTTKKIVKKSHK